MTFCFQVVICCFWAKQLASRLQGLPCLEEMGKGGSHHFLFSWEVIKRGLAPQSRSDLVFSTSVRKKRMGSAGVLFVSSAGQLHFFPPFHLSFLHPLFCGSIDYAGSAKELSCPARRDCARSGRLCAFISAEQKPLA